MSLPLFTSGTARGGTTLLGQMLSANKQVSLADDPFLALFRQFRNAVLLGSGDSEVKESLVARSPLDDYYFSQLKLRAMQLVQQANLDIAYNRDMHQELIEGLKTRTWHTSANLVQYFDMLPGRSFSEVFGNALSIIAKAHHVEDRRWVGFNENWAVEFFLPLAREFPEARFIIIIRDPRAAIASSLRAEDPTQIAHVLSFLRGWRKYVAFAVHFSQQSIFRNRLFVLTYEDLVQQPEQVARNMSEFLDVPFDPAMLDTNNFWSFSEDPKGHPWASNSHFDTRGSGIYTTSMDAWKASLSEDVKDTIKLVCEPDMALMGYATTAYTGRSFPSPECIEFIARDSKETQGWRTDFGDIERDVGSELFRKVVLFDYSGSIHDELIQRCFLFDDVYLALKNKKSLSQSLSTTDGAL